MGASPGSQSAKAAKSEQSLVLTRLQKKWLSPPECAPDGKSLAGLSGVFSGGCIQGDSDFADGCLSLEYPSPLPQSVTSEGRGPFTTPPLPGTLLLRKKELPD